MTTKNCLAWIFGPDTAHSLRQLRADGSLAVDFPEVDALYGVPQTPEHHPEVCTGLHIELCLAAADSLNANPRAKFGVLVHDLGKALTPKTEWPKHVDHESLGLAPVDALCSRLEVPADWRELARIVCEYHLHTHRAFELRPQSVLRFFEKTSMVQLDQRAEDFFVACESDARGRLGKHDRAYVQGQYLRSALQAIEALPALDESLRNTREWQDRHAERLRAVTTARAPFAAPKESHC